MEGKRGRRPKWRAVEFDQERAVAIAVELERRRARISGRRTPAGIFQRAADAMLTSRGSAARFYALHREEAEHWARYIDEDIPRHRREYRELRALYGEAIGHLPAVACDTIYAARSALKPSEIPGFDRAVRLFIAEKGRKSG